jgi:hypothetical protein
VTGRTSENPPAPVTLAVQGVFAVPSNSTDAGQDTVVVVAVRVGPLTVTVKVAGARLKVPPVSLDVWLSEIVVVPGAPDVTVRDFTSPHDPKVTLLGLAVATAGLEDRTPTTRVEDALKLQPFFTSPLVGSTLRVVEPIAPPEVRVIVSAAASMDASTVL